MIYIDNAMTDSISVIMTSSSVLKTSTGVRVNGNDFTVEPLYEWSYGSLFHFGKHKAMSGEHHVYTILEDTLLDGNPTRIVEGPDYDKWRDLSRWLVRNDKPMEQWSDLDDFPENYVHEGKTYQIIGADRTWPLPELILDGKLVGHLDTETDTETGASKQVIRWV